MMASDCPSTWPAGSPGAAGSLAHCRDTRRPETATYTERPLWLEVISVAVDPYPESTEPDRGGARKGHHRDGEETVPADRGRAGPIVACAGERSRSCGGRRQQGTLAGRFVRREWERSSTDWWMRARMVDRLPAPRSGGKRQGAQSGQGASELGLPRPAPRQVQGQAAG